MKTVTWKYARPLMDDMPIKKMEGKFNKTFPMDYVECVLESNAGTPSRDVFETERRDERVFGGLLSVIESDDVNVYESYDDLSDRLDRDDVFPFAEDPGGNYICFDYSQSPPTVVFWDHETNELEPVSRTFSDLLNKLYEDKD